MSEIDPTSWTLAAAFDEQQEHANDNDDDEETLAAAIDGGFHDEDTEQLNVATAVAVNVGAPPPPPPPPPPPRPTALPSVAPTSSSSSSTSSSSVAQPAVSSDDEGFSANAILSQLGRLNKVTMMTDVERAEKLEKSSLTGELKSVLLKKQKSKVIAEKSAVSEVSERLKAGFDSLAEAKKVALEAQKLQTISSSGAYVDLCNTITLMEGLDSTFQNARRLLQQSEAFVAVESVPTSPMDQRSRAGSMPNLLLDRTVDRSRTDLQMLATQMNACFNVLMRAAQTLNEILAIAGGANFRIDFDQLSSLANELCIRIASRIYEIGIARYHSIGVGVSKFDAMWRVKSAALFLQTAITMSTSLFKEGRETNQDRAKKSLELLNLLSQSYSEVMEYFKPDTELASSVELQPNESRSAQPRVTGLRGWFSACYHGNVKLVQQYLNGLLSKSSAQQKEKEPEDISDDIRTTGILVCENIDQEDHMGDTGLSLAIRKRQDAVAKLLISLGANTLRRNRRGDSLLHIAAASGSLVCCELLCSWNPEESKSLLEAANSMQETPLFAACKSAATADHIAVIQFLLKQGATVGSKNRSGQTPLQMLSIKLQPSSSAIKKSASSYSQPLLLDFKRYCKSKELSDVSFVVEGVTFPAHKIILCVQSEPFRALLEKNGWKDVGDNIEIPEVKAATFSLMLDFLYTGDAVIPMGDLTLHFGLLKCADMYLLHGLKEKIEKSLELNLSLENAFAIQLQAVLFGLKELRSLSTRFILDNYHELEFADPDHSFIAEMLQEIANVGIGSY